ncbi:saoe class I histocompatibility antigen, C alpha chain-like [Talpa occidentalis]|uniref:saoe class I histocompatibility antigen, C alpha chain-like n=1 Tax=Talpa occidentalis TaxID=50954 RepID=UPI0023F71811|nr:saoe class I histocompatibility antigen, C alpha chain-like [Talpa occidentalis]
MLAWVPPPQPTIPTDSTDSTMDIIAALVLLGAVLTGAAVASTVTWRKKLRSTRRKLHPGCSEPDALWGLRDAGFLLTPTL